MKGAGLRAGHQTRADLFLVRKGYVASRAEASAAIASGGMTVDGRTVAKPSEQISEGAAVTVRRAHPYVSRGGIKLAAALDRFVLSPKGLECLDLGASTGGFTQVLLERGARCVYALDVGHGQLSPALAGDTRIVVREGVNARDLTAEHVPVPVGAIVADVSFIGLRLVLPPAMRLAARGAWLVALFKPQFEVGRVHVGKGGIVRDEAVRQKALTEFLAWLAAMPGWRVLGRMESPIAGGDGNREYLIAAQNAP